MAGKWYENVYFRNVVDMHITDNDERFMTQLDPETYVEMLVRSKVGSAVVYAQSLVGLCFFPSTVAGVHAEVKNRDIFGELVAECHRRGIAVQGYYSLIYDTYAYRHNADWRIIGHDGQGVGDHSRYGVCCPNSPYRDYVAAAAKELCELYDFEGIRFDMAFWPAVCYCRHCQQRFADEVGGELPKTIHWEDPHWVAFARKREEWMTEFAALLTRTAKAVKPRLSVEHQSATFPLPWRFGVTTSLAAQTTFLQGDFYGDALQGSFVRKLFYNLTPNRPGGFETSIAVDLYNYTALKPEELLRAKAHAALADGSAFIFIDSIDPLGTLNPTVYERMGRIFGETKAYEPYLGGELCQDVAVYLSTESKGDFADNGKAVDDPTLSSRAPHVDSAVSTCRALIDHHIPFGVVTRRSLGELARHQILVLPNVLMMDEEEATAIREYVRAGGKLYASKYTSLITTDGRRLEDLMLGDVLGVSYRGETAERFTYIAPVAGHEAVFAQYTRAHPPGMATTQLMLEARPGAEVWGEQVLPYTDPADPIHFASIHNNPPGVYTGRPALVANAFGKGRAIYAAFDLESLEAHRNVFMNLLRALAEPFFFEAEAPKAVEVTMFHQPERRRFIVNMINFQKELPNIPVDGINVRIRLDGKTPERLLVLPDESRLGYEVQGGYLEFVAPRLETFAMFALDYD